jgi:hypothetical protein
MTDLVIALAAKLGADSSSVATSIDKLLTDVIAAELVDAANVATLFADLDHQDTVLTSAEVQALRATNITVVDAPAAGFAVLPVMVFFFLAHAGNSDFVQTNGTDHLALRWSASNELIEIGTEAQITSLLEASADAALYVPLAAGTVPEEATAIDLDNNGAAEFSGNADDDNTLSVRVWYATVPMAELS